MVWIILIVDKIVAVITVEFTALLELSLTDMMLLLRRQLVLVGTNAIGEV